MAVIYLSIIFFIISLIFAKYKIKNKKRVVAESIIIFFYGLISIIYFSSDYFTNDGINETVLATLSLGISNMKM